MINHINRLMLARVTLLMVTILTSLSISANPAASLNALSDPLDQISWYQQNNDVIQASPEDLDKAKVFQRIGRAYYNTGNSVLAGQMFRSALGIASRRGSQERFLAPLYNDFGLVSVARSDLGQALAYFRQSAATAATAGDESTGFVATLNVVRTLLGTGETAAVPGVLGELRGTLARMSGAEVTTAYHLDLAQLYRQSVVAGVMTADKRLDALQLYQKALASAELRSQKAAMAIANGYVGELYEDEGQLQAALDYTRRALFLAQQVADDLVLYRWQWQLGRILRSQGQTDDSLDAYRQSISSLQRAKSSLSSAANLNYTQSIGPVYYELADMLLAQSRATGSETLRQNNLLEVIDLLEAVKLAEVEDYFDSDCVLLPEDRIQLSDVVNGNAVVYPVLLQDRTELLVQTASGVQQFMSAASAAQIRSTVNIFRAAIENYDREHSYRQSAQTLYGWLITPIEAALAAADVKTLVIVPDGPLRSIPMGALYDGRKFLIEKFALATTPGISLTEPKPLVRDDIKVLAGGLTESVQGYSALPSVGSELDDIEGVFTTARFQNDRYLLSTISDQLSGGEYQVVHLATHGEFNSDHAKSFLLTYDDKLTMSRLENIIGLRRFQSEAIELLVLSACQTAVGDERAALGLAGIALKAGARSALATLWFVNDEATSQLIADFYRQLGTSSTSKAEALQTAQVKMLSTSGFSHPSYWAPFLMIGNWM